MVHPKLFLGLSEMWVLRNDWGPVAGIPSPATFKGKEMA